MDLFKAATTKIRLKITGSATVRVSPSYGDRYNLVQNLLLSDNNPFNTWILDIGK